MYHAKRNKSEGNRQISCGFVHVESKKKNKSTDTENNWWLPERLGVMERGEEGQL